MELVLDNPAGVASRGRDQSAGYARRRRPSRDRGRGFNSRRLHWLQRVRNPLDFAPLQVFNEAKLRSVRTTECRNLRAAAERRGRNSAADRAGVGHNDCTALASSGPQGAIERGRWQTHSVGRTVGFDPAPRQLSGSSVRRPSATASLVNSTKSASSSAETMASRWSSKSESRASLVMLPVATEGVAQTPDLVGR